MLVRYEIMAPPQYIIRLASSTQLKRGRIANDMDAKFKLEFGERALKSRANCDSTLRDSHVSENDPARKTTARTRPN